MGIGFLAHAREVRRRALDLQRHERVHIVSEDEKPEESCLHCDINELVHEYLEGEEDVDVGKLTALMSESLVELILVVPEEERGNLFAATIAHLGHMFLVKSGAVEGSSETAH